MLTNIHCIVHRTMEDTKAAAKRQKKEFREKLQMQINEVKDGKRETLQLFGLKERLLEKLLAYTKICGLESKHCGTGYLNFKFLQLNEIWTISKGINALLSL